MPDWQAMALHAADWATIASLATAGGTLVLAVATFAAVRSSNRSARISELALQEQRRPLLAPSRMDDPVQKIMFLEGNWVRAAGGQAAVQVVDGTVYLAISLRNVGSGIAVCQGWALRPGEGSQRTYPSHVPLEEFRLQARDLYIPAGDIGMWQGALRDPDDPVRRAATEEIESQRSITVELLYSDQVGRQRTISRFGLLPANEIWIASLTRHWYLDSAGPRPEGVVLSAAEQILREQQAATQRRAENGTGSNVPDASVADGGVDSEG
jgi:hypothetical protein